MKTPLKRKNMGDRYMNDFAPVQDAKYVYAEAVDGSQVKIKKSDLLSALFKPMILPQSSVNTIGNYDALDSGYGYYNNINGSSNEYAPALTAGLFFRFKLSQETYSVTFFFPSDYGEKILWYRITGRTCVKL